VSLTVMLMGLTTEEDTKRSKSGWKAPERDACGKAARTGIFHRLKIAKAKSRPRPRLIANPSQ